MSDDHDRLEIAKSVRRFLEGLGVAAEPGVEGTPERVATLWSENLLSGYGQSAPEALGHGLPDTAGAVVSLTGIPFHSVCPHHLLPYHGRVHLAYEPAGRIVGLGHLERLVACLSRRLVLQEDLTRSLVDALSEHLGARGAACAIDAEHLCLVLQGAEPRGARLQTRLAVGSLEFRADVLPPVGHRPDPG